MLQNAPHGELFRDKLSSGSQSWEAVLSLPDTRLSRSFAFLRDGFFTGIFIECVSTTEVQLLVISVDLSASPWASTPLSSSSLVLHDAL